MLKRLQTNFLRKLYLSLHFTLPYSGWRIYVLILIQIYNIFYTFRKPFGSTLIICKKICKQWKMILKALTTTNSNMQKYFKNLIFIQGKLKMCKFSLKASVQKNYAKFLRKKMCNLLFFVQGFPKKIKSQNPKTTSRYKYRFSRVKEK